MRARALQLRGFRPAFVLVITLAANTCAQDAPAIRWCDDFDQAVAQSKARRLPLWIQFTAPWCAYCQKMDREALLDPQVVAIANGHFVAVRMSADVRGDLMARYAVSALPAIVIVDPAGSAVERAQGYQDAMALVTLLEKARSQVAPLALDGGCPVSLVRTGQWKAGHRSFAVHHGGLTYYCANRATQAAFVRDPDRYAPAARGISVVSEVDGRDCAVGDAHYGVYYKKRLYLFTSETERQRFSADPERYASAGAKVCAHCERADSRVAQKASDARATRR